MCLPNCFGHLVIGIFLLYTWHFDTWCAWGEVCGTLFAERV